MPAKEYYFEQIEKEFGTAREALTRGNDGKARVCARRAVGHGIAWFLTTHLRQNWGTDAMNRLVNLKDDGTFPQEVRDAAARLTARISDGFTYPFSTNPIDDARLIVNHIEKLMESNAD